MAMAVVAAYELLLQNRAGTELAAPYHLLNLLDGGLQVEFQYQWITHVTGVALEIQGDLELDMKVAVKEGDGLNGGAWACLFLRDCDGVIEKLGDTVSASLSEMTFQIAYGSNFIDFKGVQRVADNQYDCYQKLSPYRGTELLSDWVKSCQFKAWIMFG